MACPCTLWQAWLERVRFSWNWRYSWPEYCFESTRSKFISYYSPLKGPVGLWLKQECCYSTQWEDWGSLKIGPPDGGRVKVTAFHYRFNRVKTFYTDEDAYQYCCVDIPLCNAFYFYRPSDDCSRYIPPPRREFYCKLKYIVMSCHVMSCHVMSIHVTSRNVTSCRTVRLLVHLCQKPIRVETCNARAQRLNIHFAIHFSWKHEKFVHECFIYT